MPITWDMTIGDVFIAALTAHQHPTDPATLTQLMQRKAHAYLDSVREHQVIFPGAIEFVRESPRSIPWRSLPGPPP